MTSRKIIINKISRINAESIGSKDAPEVIHYLDTSSITRNRIEKIQVLDSKIAPFPSRAQRKVRNGTIIYSTVRPEQEHFGYIEIDTKNLIVSSGFLTIDITDVQIDPKYLYYLITRRDITNYLQTIAVNNVSTYPSINPDDLGNLEFVIPSDIATQQKIAAIISALDAKIELNQRINAELESMAKTLYDYWFVQFDFPNEKGQPYKSSGGEMVWNDALKREIPLEWEVKKLADFCAKIGDGIHGTPEYVEISEYSFINGNNLKNGFIDIDVKTNKISSEEYEKYFIELNEGTILLSINGTLGNLAVYTGEKVMLGKSAAYINCTEKNRPYCYQFLKLDHIQKKFWNIATGSTIKNLSLDSLKNLLIPFPGNDLIEQYYYFAKPMNDKRKNIFKETQTLTDLRDWLLPMLMNGQVKV